MSSTGSSPPSDRVLLAYFRRVTAQLQAVEMPQLAQLAAALETARRSKQTVHILGNGGSDANAAHAVLHLRECGVRARDLLADLPHLTALSNDHSYQDAPRLALRQADATDALLVITGSGESANVLLALLEARKRGLTTLGLLGFGGGAAAQLCDAALTLNCCEYGPVEDTHSVCIHALQAALKGSG